MPKAHLLHSWCYRHIDQGLHNGNGQAVACLELLEIICNPGVVYISRSETQKKLAKEKLEIRFYQK